MLFSLVRDFLRSWLRAWCLLLPRTMLAEPRGLQSKTKFHCTTLVEPWLQPDSGEPRERYGGKNIDEWLASPVALLLFRLTRFFLADAYLATASMRLFYDFVQIEPGKLSLSDLNYIMVACFGLSTKHLCDEAPTLSYLSQVANLNWKQLRFFESRIFFRTGCRCLSWLDIQPIVADMEYLLNKPRLSQHFTKDSPPQFLPISPARRKPFDRERYLRAAHVARVRSSSAPHLGRTNSRVFNVS